MQRTQVRRLEMGMQGTQLLRANQCHFWQWAAEPLRCVGHCCHCFAWMLPAQAVSQVSKGLFMLTVPPSVVQRRLRRP